MNETDLIDDICPHCQGNVVYPMQVAGKVQSCPHCGVAFIVTQVFGGKGQKLPLPIKTNSLIIRRLNLKDSKDICELMCEEGLFRFFEWQFGSSEDVDEWLEQDSRLRFAEGEV